MNKRYSIPVFTPPLQAQGYQKCCHHKNEPAYTRCSNCNRGICRGCAEHFGINSEQTQHKNLCYDCTLLLVKDNIKNIKKHRRKIVFDLIMTLFFAILGIILGIFLLTKSSSNFFSIFIFAVVFGSEWIVIKELFKIFECDSIMNYLIYTFKFYLKMLIAPFITIITIIRRSNEWKEMNRIINSDKKALAMMKDYLEYSQMQVRNNDNNIYLKSLLSYGEATTNKMLRNIIVSITSNGEIIRSYH